MVKKHINHAGMRNLNLSLLLNTLRKNSPVSRAELAQFTGINRATVSGLVKTLIKNGVVIELGVREDDEVGHPSIDLALNPDLGQIIGCEIGQGFINIGISDLAGKLYQQLEIDTPKFVDGSELLPHLYQGLDEIYQVAEAEKVPILGIGITLPGMVNIDEGRVLSCPMLDWYDFPLGELIETRYPVPIYIGNVSHMAALGESYFGKAKKSNHVLYIYAGYGISGSYLTDGDVLPGASDLAGEFGKMHLAVVEENNRSYTWEDLADQNAFLRRVSQALHDGQESMYATNQEMPLSFDPSEIRKAIENQDAVVLDALQETSFWLGVGVANLISALNPEMVVLGGAYAHLSSYMIPKINQVVKERVFFEQCQVCDVKTTAFLKFGGTIGAAATVFWEMLQNPEDWF